MSVSAEERMGRAGGRSERWDRGKATNGNGQEKQSRTRGRIKALTLEELESLPKRDYLLKGLISRGEISIWVGPPKCGKSFLLLFVPICSRKANRCSDGASSQHAFYMSPPRARRHR